MLHLQHFQKPHSHVIFSSLQFCIRIGGKHKLEDMSGTSQERWSLVAWILIFAWAPSLLAEVLCPYELCDCTDYYVDCNYKGFDKMPPLKPGTDYPQRTLYVEVCRSK
ncbi:uncharacterized protein LOC101856292 [Aplysia californica]|uniref:Uncharacterized protein LOC101856292 n=1 Tax=Aplysia californica TaxID=6500 RepID=A0ABM1A9F8_APLCA|nr:uncharacterized protein LOC101856292 [Aplysia californica]